VRPRPVRLAPGETWPELRSHAEVWLPLAAEALDRNGLRLDADAFLGPGGSYPAVISGDLVVKFYGFAGEWLATWTNERLAHERLGLDGRILAPRLLGVGEFFPGEDQPLPYLILTRIPGQSWCDAPLSFAERLTVAAELGRQLRLVHALPCHGMPNIDAWLVGSVGEGARHGDFPSDLTESVDAWLESVPVAPPAFVHSDLFVRHPFVLDGHLSGVIDWGDAMAADPHVELAKIHLDVFEGEKRLLQAFLDAYDWPVDAEFPRRCLAMALRRHAQILGQHGGGDVFYRVPELIAGKRIANLDELADELFGI
jgi:hygromycin-B 7''-O-kinase